MMFPHFNKLVEAEFEQNCSLLDATDFPDAKLAIRSLMRLHDASMLFESAELRSLTSEPAWFKILKRIFLEAPFPEAVLSAVDSFVVRNSSPADAFQLFEESPRSLEVLARISCGSPFLTQTLLEQPESLRELTIERRTAAMKSREEFVVEAQAAIAGETSSDGMLSELRRFQRREILRIGMCDAFGLLDLKFVTLQISLLADAMVQICLRIACDEQKVIEPPFSVIALGKHGGEELNYSSDIDLVLIGKSDNTSARIARRLIVGLSQKMATGFLYRVDMRLRPWGDAGSLVCSPETYEAYLRTDAEPWEKQALLKARVVAGALEPGEQFLQQLPALVFDVTEQQVLDGVRLMKEKIEARLRKTGQLETEVKLGSGSIRDIEFLVQALQLIHGKAKPQLASPNTLDALVKLAESGVLDASVYRQLREGYVFLRTIEHALQLLHNQQTHELPAGQTERDWLARRLDYPDSTVLLARFSEHRRAIRRAFDAQFNVSQQTNSQVTRSTKDNSAAVGTSALARFFRNEGASNRIDSSPSLIQRDVETGSMCRVQIAATGDADSEFVVSIATSVGSGIVSMICGIFFANHLDIREGDAVHGPGRNRFDHDVAAGRFLGTFLCHDMSAKPIKDLAEKASALESELKLLLTLQQEGQDSNVRALLLEMFCKREADRPPSDVPGDDLLVVINESVAGSPNVMQISADDSLGFLFEVSNALSICGFRIRHAEVGESNGRINDTLHVTESDGSPVLRPERLEELKTAVTLIKQFTNWLPSTNDAHQALLRFRDLLGLLLTKTHWASSAASLKQPEVLRAVSRVLGISRYLWEDFLQVKTAKLLPLLTAPDLLQTRISRTDLELEVRSLINDAASCAEQRQVLNEFKDHHLFRIDLRHVLGYCGPFGSFAAEITELAEIVVDSACQTAFTELVSKHGKPVLADGRDCYFAIVALGKFGGIEMGFASDIEMFLVFEADCRTDGEATITAASFFERLIQQVSTSIQSRHKGIFEIDLRMRPYGQAGSPAVSLTSFRTYFGISGEAWPYERQSLVKLRCVCGMPEFRDELVQVCHSIVYSDSSFDFDALRAMREKQVRQLVRGGTVNAKLSDGGLVDCEYAAQALQMTFGVTHPQLRTSNTLAAIEAAHKLELLTLVEYNSARDAYTFLRELIDCLRMARGDAQDLTIPHQDSAEYEFLAKRMDAVHDSPLRLEMLEDHLAAVRRFAALVEQICSQSAKRLG